MPECLGAGPDTASDPSSLPPSIHEAAGDHRDLDVVYFSWFLPNLALALCRHGVCVCEAEEERSLSFT